MEQIRKNILEASLLIDKAAKALPEGQEGDKYDDAYFALKTAINSLTEADTILFEEDKGMDVQVATVRYLSDGLVANLCDDHRADANVNAHDPVEIIDWPKGGTHCDECDEED